MPKAKAIFGEARRRLSYKSTRPIADSPEKIIDSLFLHLAIIISSQRIAVSTDKAPKPRPGIYNQAIVANGFVYTSGMTAKDLVTGVIIGGTIEDRTHHCIRSLGAVLEAAGSSLNDVIEVNLYLTNLDDFDRVNAVYKTYWGEMKPARTCIIVKNLPGNTDVEIKCVGLVVKEQPSSKL